VVPEVKVLLIPCVMQWSPDQCCSP